MNNELENKTYGYLIAYASRMVSGVFQERIKQYNVSVGQYTVLVHLWEEEGLTQSSLCDLIRVEQPTLANTLKRMERDDLIQRKPDENDKRLSRIYLTKRASELKKQLMQESKIVNKIVIQGMSSSEQTAFKEMILRVSKNLENSERPLPPR